MSLRDEIAEMLRGEAVVEILDQQKQSGEPQYVECVDGWTYIVDGTVDFDKMGKYLADRILALDPSITTSSKG